MPESDTVPVVKTGRTKLSSKLIVGGLLTLSVLVIASSWFTGPMAPLFMIFPTGWIAVLVLFAMFVDLRSAMAALLATCVVLSVWIDQWPARVRFELSRGVFEEIVERIENDEAVEFPRRIGFYRFHSFTKEDSGAILFSSLCVEKVSRGNITGVVYCPNERFTFNEFCRFDFDDDWLIAFHD